MSMRKKILLLNIGGLLVLGVLSIIIAIRTSYSYSQNEISQLRSLMWEERKNQISDLIENACTVVKSAHYWMDAQRTINEMRYGHDKSNYFFVMDTDGMVFVHPHQPELVGKVQLELKDADGRKIIKEIVDMAKEKGQGYIEHRGYSPKTNQPVKQLTYFKLYKEWKWIVCTSIVVDDIDLIIDHKEMLYTENMKQHVQFQMILMASVLICVAGVSAIISRRMATPIATSIKMINDISVQVTSASSNVLVSSRQLAQHASEQKKIIQNSLQIMDEIVTHTRQNVEHANDIRAIMSETQEMVNQTAQSLKKLNDTMKWVIEATEQIQHIVKTIDSLSFNIRLIALNAAIEAARLGKDGTGFAVIADEIRKLSDHSAKEAKQTAQTLESAQNRIKDGLIEVENSHVAFDHVLKRIHHTADIIYNITTASKQQHEGFERIREAALAIVNVAGYNSTSAQQSALDAKTMKTQAEQMNLIVSELVKLVKGESRNGHRTLRLKKLFNVVPLYKKLTC